MRPSRALVHSFSCSEPFRRIIVSLLCSRFLFPPLSDLGTSRAYVHFLFSSLFTFVLVVLPALVRSFLLNRTLVKPTLLSLSRSRFYVLSFSREQACRSRLLLLSWSAIASEPTSRGHSSQTSTKAGNRQRRAMPKGTARLVRRRLRRPIAWLRRLSGGTALLIAKKRLLQWKKIRFWRSRWERDVFGNGAKENLLKELTVSRILLLEMYYIRFQFEINQDVTISLVHYVCSISKFNSFPYLRFLRIYIIPSSGALLAAIESLFIVL